jgi:nucleotide-binding universal stress UspA family protein
MATATRPASAVFTNRLTIRFAKKFVDRVASYMPARSSSRTPLSLYSAIRRNKLHPAVPPRRAGRGVKQAQRVAGGRSLASAPSVISRAGDPFRVIVDEADTLKADLEMMGAHRNRLLGEVFTGTTIERVMSLGRQSVLMVNRDGEVP